ncbi:unnamed protein product [Pseudo-nitzschia multistriata]|uniref:Uncharacterized protein n=1 Tax=Pseudo-nitzschia multistriata TaxID=183589 RepID=A0A448Z976_9STRA|nr:unnamed protein product [Pseudo-nitzschia multistriata]
MSTVVNVSVSYGVEAFLCDPSTGTKIVPMRPFAQGSIVSACVRPDAASRSDGLVMDRIENFTWKKESNGTPAALNFAAEQPVVLEGSHQDVLSVSECAPDKAYCAVTSILFADFFQYAGPVSALGNVYLAFANPQEDALSDSMLIDFDVSIIGSSGASLR